MNGTSYLTRAATIRQLRSLLSPCGTLSTRSQRGNRTKARNALGTDDQLPVFQYESEKTKRRKRVYAWGSSLTGALGHDKLVRPRLGHAPRPSHNKPYRLPFSEFYLVDDVACGYGFTLFSAQEDRVKNPNKVYGTGINTDFQLGYQCARKGHPLKVLTEPVGIPLPLRKDSTRILRVACGRSHSVVLTDNEGAFSFGNNSFGQCGRPVIQDESPESYAVPRQVQGIPEKIIDVVCGQDHTLFLTASGAVYSCGWSADGQTGLGIYGSQGTPGRVNGDLSGVRIVKIAGTVDCILAVSDSGDLFGWGNSEYGQFGRQTDEKQMCYARHLNFPHGKVKAVASGGTMCGVVTESGDAYVWGYGLLGLGPEVSVKTHPTLLPRPLFGASRFAPDTSVVDLFCGLNHFAALNNKGELYTWGKNKNGCLGLGHTLDQHFPFRVSLTAHIMKVSCGVDHTAVLCQSFC
uniref:Putative e3 ubiquitin-protein ligase herc3 n=1 Tax=Amblyomma aureolatum TaxID=187763 RepID=A0A1E1XBA0_9ACAR